MFKFKVLPNEVVFVRKKDEYIKVLGEGSYFRNFQETYLTYKRWQDFSLNHLLDDLLLVKGFKEQIDLIDVQHNHLGLLFINGILDKVYTAGRYAIWKSARSVEIKYINIVDIYIDESIDRALLHEAPLSEYVRAVVVEPHEKGILWVDGNLHSIIDPGKYFFWKNYKSIQLKRADMRVINLEMNGQELLTKDKVQIRMNFIAQYQVKDIHNAIVENSDYERQIYVLFQVALRNYVGQMTIDELMSSKEHFNEMILASIEANAALLGLEILMAGNKDIILPGEIRDIMNQVLIAEKRAQANVITRREETASTRSLLNTAKLLEENAMLYKLKELEYVEKMVEKVASISVNGSNNLLDQFKNILIK